MFSLDEAHKDIQRYFDAIAAAGVIPLMVGGDHSVTYSTMKSLAKKQKEPLAVIHVDSHTDTWGEYRGSKYHHGAPFRLGTEEGFIDPQKTVQIGIRGGQNFSDGLDYSREKGMRMITIEEFDDLGWKAVAEEARRIVGDSPVYLTFDIDGLDPAYASGTGTPEPGGSDAGNEQKAGHVLQRHAATDRTGAGTTERAGAGHPRRADIGPRPLGPAHGARHHPQAPRPWHDRVPQLPPPQ